MLTACTFSIQQTQIWPVTLAANHAFHFSALLPGAGAACEGTMLCFPLAEAATEICGQARTPTSPHTQNHPMPRCPISNTTHQYQWPQYETGPPLGRRPVNGSGLPRYLHKHRLWTDSAPYMAPDRLAPCIGRPLSSYNLIGFLGLGWPGNGSEPSRGQWGWRPLRPMRTITPPAPLFT